MKLNRTREEWESYRALHSKQDCAALYHHAVADLLALSAENARLTAQLAEAEKREIAWRGNYETWNRHTEILEAQLAEREGRIKELEGAVANWIDPADVPPHIEALHEAIWSRFHAAEDKSHDA